MILNKRKLALMVLDVFLVHASLIFSTFLYYGQETSEIIAQWPISHYVVVSY